MSRRTRCLSAWVMSLTLLGCSNPQPEQVIESGGEGGTLPATDLGALGDATPEDDATPGDDASASDDQTTPITDDASTVAPDAVVVPVDGAPPPPPVRTH